MSCRLQRFPFKEQGNQKKGDDAFYSAVSCWQKHESAPFAVRHRTRMQVHMQSDLESTCSGSGWVKGHLELYMCFMQQLRSRCASLRSLLLLLVFFLHVVIVLAVCLQQLVPPSEGGGVVAHKVHVMEVVETAAGVEWDQVKWVPWDVITTGRKKEKYKWFFS